MAYFVYLLFSCYLLLVISLVIPKVYHEEHPTHMENALLAWKM